jgi:uncharacterized protein with ParB-like and HNH nuclease domain
MLRGNQIRVPDYQRAFSWETQTEKSGRDLHVNTFMHDLESFAKSKAKSYYFGHFLFREEGKNTYEIVDGQQRLTTIVIFLSALFARLKEIRELNDDEKECYEDMVKRNTKYTFSTVDYDRQIFKDYVINQTRKDIGGEPTVSAKRIGAAFDFFEYIYKIRIPSTSYGC